VEPRMASCFKAFFWLSMVDERPLSILKPGPQMG
jgi:hypothetical protein